MQRGDTVIQKSQLGAVPCLVVSLIATWPRVVVVHDPDGDRYKRILVIGYELVRSATDQSTKEALDHLLSEGYAQTTSRPHW